jgi:hypothetical protein
LLAWFCRARWLISAFEVTEREVKVHEVQPVREDMHEAARRSEAGYSVNMYDREVYIDQSGSLVASSTVTVNKNRSFFRKRGI